MDRRLFLQTIVSVPLAAIVLPTPISSISPLALYGGSAGGGKTWMQYQHVNELHGLSYYDEYDTRAYLGFSRK